MHRVGFNSKEVVQFTGLWVVLNWITNSPFTKTPLWMYSVVCLSFCLNLCNSKNFCKSQQLK